MSNSVLIDAGKFKMGADQCEMGHPLDNENPRTDVEVDSFWIDSTTVTNSKFQEFVEETGYVTEAERYGGSFVFHLLLSSKDIEKYKATPNTPWWIYVEDASWRQPEGPESTISHKMDHPVVHVSRNDAIEYCNWAGKRLPTEAEWEYAARAGATTSFPWGDELNQEGKYHANTWQGEFPTKNTEKDGYLSTAPVKAFEPNANGLYQVVGNVWEWCLNPGRIDLEEFTKKSPQDFYNNYWKESNNNFATKGGSFLCHSSYCNRYRLGARNQKGADSSSSNVGFRCVSF